MHKPRFRPDLHVEVVPPDKVFLLSEALYHTLSGRIYALLAPLIAGARNVDEIVHLLPPDISPMQAHYALHQLQERGFIVEAVTSGTDAEAAYWTLHQKTVLPSAANTIRIRALDVPDAFTPMAEQVGLRVETDAPLTLLAVNDYLNPALEAWNAAALRDQRAWLLVKPVGGFLWIGPLFAPGVTACWTCLAQRLRGNRPLEAFIERSNDATTPIMLSRAALPTTINAAAALAL